MKNKNLNTLGQRVKYVRECILKQTQIQLAKKLGITQQNLSLVENDKIDPPRDSLQTYAKTLGVNVTWLEWGIGDMYSGEEKGTFKIPFIRWDEQINWRRKYG